MINRSFCSDWTENFAFSLVLFLLLTEITSGSEHEKIISSCIGNIIWLQWNQFKKKKKKKLLNNWLGIKQLVVYSQVLYINFKVPINYFIL